MTSEQTSLSPDEVNDRKSFIRFVSALIEDRKSAEAKEKEAPEAYRLGGANNWQNTTISSYLECALAGAEEQDDWGDSNTSSWRDLALFLYLGKIYE